MGAGSKTGASQKVWEIKTWNWNLPVKMAPGITQFERRLGAPLHGLMNAYQKLFTRFKKESLVPRWKTLILEDKEGAWLGRILYSRKTSSLTGTTGTVADWKCEVQLPAEHKDRILECWRDVWYVRPAEAAALTDGSREGSLCDRLAEDQPRLRRRRPLEPLPHKGGPHLQRGRGTRHRELGGTL